MVNQVKTHSFSAVNSYRCPSVRSLLIILSMSLVLGSVSAVQYDRDDANNITPPPVVDVEDTFTGSTLVEPVKKSIDESSTRSGDEFEYEADAEDDVNDDEEDEEIITSDLDEKMYDITSDPNEEMYESLLELGYKAIGTDGEAGKTGSSRGPEANKLRKQEAQESLLKEYLAKIGAIDKVKRTDRFAKQKSQEKLASIKKRAHTIPTRHRNLKQKVSRSSSLDTDVSNGGKRRRVDEYTRSKARNMKNRASGSYNGIKSKSR